MSVKDKAKDKPPVAVKTEEKPKPSKTLYVAGRKFKEGAKIPKGLIPDEEQVAAAKDAQAKKKAKAEAGAK